jgi:FHS family L-fucose permease-like MFS transporter
MAIQTKPAASSAPNYTIPFIIVTALFGIFGFLTNLNSNLAPKLQDIFHLNYMWSNFVTTSWFLAYLVFSVPSGKLIEKIGYKSSMVTSLFIMVVGALLFVPAAAMVSFPFFLTASFVLATGVCVLQVSANPYVSILGPEHSAPARLTLAQAFNSLGSALAPIVVGFFILTEDTKNASPAVIAHTVQGPYIAIAISLLVLGFAVMFMYLPAIVSSRTAVAGAPASGRSIWSYKHTVLSMIGIFFYVGLEIALAANAIKYFLAQGVDLIAVVSHFFSSLGWIGSIISHLLGTLTEHKVAGFLASFYMFAIMIGRFAGTVAMKVIRANRLLAGLGFFGVALLLVAMNTTGMTAVWCLILCGLANSIMYPTIFTLGIAELGPMTSKGSGVISIGNFGGAVIPPLFGWLADKIGMHYAIVHDSAGVQLAVANHQEYHNLIADRFGFQYAFVLTIICYLYIAYFGISGYKPARAVKA